MAQRCLSTSQCVTASACIAKVETLPRRPGATSSLGIAGKPGKGSKRDIPLPLLLAHRATQRPNWRRWMTQIDSQNVGEMLRVLLRSAGPSNGTFEAEHRANIAESRLDPRTHALV